MNLPPPRLTCSLCLSALAAMTCHASALTGSWYVTGCRFEGSVTSPQVTSATGSVTIITTDNTNYTLTFQLGGSPIQISVPLVQSGQEYRGEIPVDTPSYEVTRSVVIRDHGDDVLTFNWVDAGYEKVSPYNGFPDMQTFSALSAALTKTPAPSSDPGQWVGDFQYEGHLIEADDTHEVLHDQFFESLRMEHLGGDDYLTTDIDDGFQASFTLTNGQLRMNSQSNDVTTAYEDDEYLVQNMSEMESMRTIQLGQGKLVQLWFGQAIHQLTMKATADRPASGPFPSLQLGFAEVGLLTSNRVPTGPPTDATSDADSDGLPDLVETAFNLPTTSTSVQVLNEGIGTAGLPAIRRDESTSPARLRIEFVRRRDAATFGISYQPEWSSDLATWSPGAFSTVVTPIDATWERVVVTDPSPGPRRYGRVAVSLVTPP